MTNATDAPGLAPEVADRIRMVMVEPTHPGNIGAAARAIKNMGLKQLVLVNPLKFPDNEARFRSASAVDVVDAAKVVPTLAEAIDDCTLVIGASARSRSVPWPLVDAREAAAVALKEAPRATWPFSSAASPAGSPTTSLGAASCICTFPAIRPIRR